METISSMMLKEALASELRINRVRLVILLVAIAVTLANHFLSGGANANVLRADLAIAVAGLGGCGSLYWALAHPLPKSWLHFASVGLDLALVTAFLLSHSLTEIIVVTGMPGVFADAGFLFFFLVIAASAMRFSKALTIFGTLAAMGMATGIYLLDMVSKHNSPDLVRIILTLVALGSCGYLAYAIVRKSRELISKGVKQELEKEHIRQAFSRYVTREVAEEILNGNIHPSVGIRREVTILFSDIRGFTSLSETLEPEAVVALLNEYFSAMVEAVFEYGGTIDKYIGDGIMAIFGAPISQEDHALRAVKTSVAMRKALGRINERRIEKGLESLRIGIGLHSGECIIGNIGAEQRLDYTAIGDTVNTASRIESLTKDFGVDILMSASTQAQVKDEVESILMAPAQVKGKANLVTVYQVIRTAVKTRA